ncbi:MAG TPA: nickel-binding protein [Acidimicrobiales bacterium]|nr:nickel-binding protein [Acidimicrobiales bacterium]
MFIDRHDVPGVTPEELANAHRLDVAIQERHGVNYHTYWFEPENGSVFCLAEGPSKQAIETVHRESHGLLASTILELGEFAPLNDFFGSLPSHPVGTPYAAPALRVIVFTDVCGSVAQTQQLGDDGHMQMLGEHNSIVRSELVNHEGREVKHTGDGIMAAFTSVVSAIAFAVEVQRRLHRRNQEAAVPLEVSIGISAGEPVTDEHEDLFGAAVQLAARLCAAASIGDIAVSVAVRELCIGKPIRFDDLGELTLKGMPEPTRTYAVAWRD